MAHKFPFVNFALPFKTFKTSRFLRKFSVWETEICLPIYIPTEISGFLGERVNNPLRCNDVIPYFTGESTTCQALDWIFILTYLYSPLQNFKNLCERFREIFG